MRVGCLAASETTLGLIGGSGFERAFGDKAVRTPFATPYGEAVLWRLTLSERPALFWSRHGEGHVVPPHRVPTRAALWAMRTAGVKRLLATAAVGSLVPERLGPGRLILVADAMDFTRSGRPQTFFDGPPAPVVHLEASRLYCPDLGKRLRAGAQATGLGELLDAVMVVTEGPRLETPAEIRAFGRLGAEIVGMTGLPEAALARELGMAYASVAVVTNAAAGLAGAIDGAEIDRLARGAQAAMAALWRHVAADPSASSACACCPGPATPPFPWPVGGEPG